VEGERFMKNVFKATVLMALMCGVALTQNASPSSNSGTPQPQAQTSAPQTSQSAMAAQHPTRIAPGSVIPVQLTKTVDAKKAKTGDEVVAKVTMDMKTQSGDVLVPKDTKVIGHVTEAQKREKDQKQSELGLAFDHAVTKDGNTMQMPMSIQAVIGQQQNQQSEANTPAGRQEAAGVPSGAAPTGAAGGKSSSTTPPAPSPSASGSGAGADDTSAGNGGRPPITAQTQGVIGISNLTLAPASNGTQGTVMTSDKNNVKLESGTMLLLKVNQ
jgi:hypothetical protein